MNIPDEELEDLLTAETESVVVAVEPIYAPGQPMASTRIGSIARQPETERLPTITGSVQIAAHRRAVVMSAVVGAAVAAGVVAAFALLAVRGSSKAATPPPAITAPGSAPGTTTTADKSGRTTPPAASAEAPVVPPGAPVGSGAPAAEASVPEPGLVNPRALGEPPVAADPAAAAARARRRAKREAAKPAEPEASRKQPADWGLDSPLPPP